jgi:hypothetical protein
MKPEKPLMFDAKTAKELPPGQHLLVDGCAGLRLEATASRKSWIYRYKNAEGRMKQVKIGPWPIVSRQDAGAKWQQLRNNLSLGVDPIVERKEKAKTAKATALKGEFTVRKLVQDYINKKLRVTRNEDGFEKGCKRALDSGTSKRPGAMSLLHEAIAHGVCALTGCGWSPLGH